MDRGDFSWRARVVEMFSVPQAAYSLLAPEAILAAAVDGVA